MSIDITRLGPLAMESFMDAPGKEWKTNKDIINDIIGIQISDGKSLLEDVKTRIEEKFQKPLSPIDIDYIEQQYIQHVSLLWLEETKHFLATHKILEFSPQTFTALENIKNLSEIPAPFDNLDFYKLLVPHLALISTQKQAILLRHFMIECWQQILSTNKDALKEIKFIKAFDDLLSSSLKLQELIGELKLKEFVQGKARFEDLLIKIMELEEQDYGELIHPLQAATRTLEEENKGAGDKEFLMKDKLRELIDELLKPPTVEVKQTDNRWLIEVKGKNFSIKDILAQVEQMIMNNLNIEEVRFVSSDFIHFDRDLMNKIWHGKNIVIICKVLNIDSSVTIEVSGLSSQQTYTQDAGTDTIGHGKPGADGHAGESGGNVALYVKSVINPEMISITANGGNGSKGQDGGDGIDGKDGNAISRIRFESDYEPSATWHNPIAHVAKTVSNIARECPHYVQRVLSHGTYVNGKTAMGNEITFSSYYGFGDQAFLLYEGTTGTTGGDGGQLGRGGEGGYPGDIYLSTSIESKMHLINRKRGRAGDDGKGGLYGKSGKNGWDLGYLDYTLWGGARYYGRDMNSKINLVTTKDTTGDVVYAPYNKSYMKMQVRHLTQPSNINYGHRNDIVREQRQTHAQAVKKKSISHWGLMKTYYQYFVSMDKNKWESLSSQIQSHEDRISEDLIQQIQANHETQELESQLHNTTAHINTYTGKPPQNIEEPAIFKDLTKGEEIIADLATNPLSLDKWLRLQEIPVQLSQFDVLFDSFEKLKKNISENFPHNSTEMAKLNTIGRLLIQKQALAELEQMAKQMFTNLPPNNIDKLPAVTASRYLIEDQTKDKLISHLVLGRLHQYFYQNTEIQRLNISKYFKEVLLDNKQLNKEILDRSLERYILEVGESQEAHPAIKTVFHDFRNYEKNYRRTLGNYMTAFRNELTRPRHAKVYELWRKSNKDPSVMSQLDQETQRDPFLSKLYGQCKSLLSSGEYKWDKCLENEEILNEFDAYILKYGPASSGCREMLAHIYDINIRIYAGDNDQWLYLKDNHNHNSNRFSHILYNGDAEEFVQMTLDEDYWLLNTTRLSYETKYTELLDMFEHLPDTNEFDEVRDILKLSKFFPSKGEGEEVRKRLNTITSHYVGEPGMLYSILLRFACEGRHVSLEEFWLLVNSIVSSSLERNMVGLTTLRWIVSSYAQSCWIDELLILEMENYLKRILTNKAKCRQLLAKIENVNVLLQLHRKLQNSRSNDSVTPQVLEDILKIISNLPKETKFNYDSLHLSEWLYALKDHYWSNSLSKLIVWHEDDLATASYYVLTMEYTFGTHVVEHFISQLEKRKKEISSATHLITILAYFHNEEWPLNSQVVDMLDTMDLKQWQKSMGHKFSALGKDRNIGQLVEVIKGNENTSKTIAENLVVWQEQLNHIFSPNYEINGKSVASFSVIDIREWRAGFRGTKDKYDEMFAIIARAIQLKRGWQLRDTQKLTTFVLLANKQNTLVQVATGEGKTIVVVALAIMKALCGEKVDVITSSSVLAKRDAEENIDIYSIFDLSVSHNCDEDMEKRKLAYSSSQVVYGDLSNFQRDYLLHTFYGKNVLGDRLFHNVIVDEVDSMLLDKGNNTLYLSHELPDLDKLESVYLFIWQWINSPVEDIKNIRDTFDVETIKEAVLYDLFGIIRMQDMAMLGSHLSDLQRNHIYERLIETNIIDGSGKLLKQTVDESTLLNEVLSTDDLKTIHPRLSHLLKQCLQRERHIHVPNHLQSFIEKHLEAWIENATKAYFMEPGQDYVVDVDRTSTSPDRNPNITIIDRDTGTDQVNSQWEEGLHQFLQLKHGCKLSLQSLKAVFISSVSYFKLYKSLYGLTGTLGSERERDLLKDLYHVDFATLPTSKTKQFIEYSPIICYNNEEWMEAVKDKANKLLANRSILIICETVNDVKILYTYFGGKEAKHIYTYTRDYEPFEWAKNDTQLEKGFIIIATNLAGRGTDIKITKDLEKAGGLHVCLTYLPANVRIEQQAFGRAARKGEKGSGQLVILDTNRSTIFKLRQDTNAWEINRLSAIKTYYESQITMEEECFKAFRDHYEELQTSLEEKKVSEAISHILLLCTLDKWAFWLDDNRRELVNIKDPEIKRRFTKSLKKFLADLKAPITANKDVSHSTVWVKWVEGNPAKMIQIGKELAHGKLKDSRQAIALFDKIISQEPEFSEAAHYYKAYALLKESEFLNEETLQKFKTELRQSRLLFEKRRESAVIASGIIGQIKANNKDSIVQVDAYEEQQENLANLYYIFQRSVDDIMGEVVSPKWLADKSISEELSIDIYEFLVQERILKKPLVGTAIPDENLRKLNSDYGLIKDTLKKFLSPYEGSNINEEDFLNALSQSVDLPSRESFWRELLHQDVLKEEKLYLIIDVGKLRSSDCELSNHLSENVANQKLTKISIDPNDSERILFKAEMFVHNEDNAAEFPDIFEKSEFLKVMGQHNYGRMLKMGVISSNRQARFDIDKAKTISLSTFDSIKAEDFSRIDIAESEVGNILKELVKRNYIEKSSETTYRLRIQFDKINDIKLILWPVYEASVRTLMSLCFAYRIALQRIIWQIEEKVFPRCLTLMSAPHEILFSDLFDRNIIREYPLDSSRKEIKKALEKMRNDSSMHLTKVIADVVLNALEGTQGQLKRLEVPDPKLKNLLEICADCDFGYITEILLFNLNGLTDVLQLNERKWTSKMILNTVLVFFLATVQIAVASALEIYSAGAMSYLSSALFSEGIKDIVFAVSALNTGLFSWKDYGSKKLKSIMKTLATVGVGPVLSETKSIPRFASKLFTFFIGSGDIKKIGLNVIAKKTLKKIVKNVSVSMANSGVDAIVKNATTELCSSLEHKILLDIKAGVEEHEVGKNLAKAYRMLGKESAETLADELGQKFFSLHITDEYFGRLFKDIYMRGAKQFSKVTDEINILSASSVTNVIRRTLVIENILDEADIKAAMQNLLDDVNKKITKKLTTVSDGSDNKEPISENDVNTFKAGTLAKWESLLEGIIGKLMEQYIISPILQKGVHLGQQIGKMFRNLYLNSQGNEYKDHFDRLKKDHQHDLEHKDSQGGAITQADSLTLIYYKDLQYLMRKTQSIELFATMVRENVSMDISYVEACLEVVYKIIKGQCSREGFTIHIEDGHGISHRFSYGLHGPVIRHKIRSNQFHFCDNDKIAKGDESLHEVISNAIPILANISSHDFREKAAHIIEHDEDVKDFIKANWISQYADIKSPPGEPIDTILENINAYQEANPSNVCGVGELPSVAEEESNGPKNLLCGLIDDPENPLLRILKQLHSMELKRSFTTDSLDTINIIQNNFKDVLEMMLQRDDLEVSEHVELKRIKASLSSMTVSEIVQNSLILYNRYKDEDIFYKP